MKIWAIIAVVAVVSAIAASLLFRRPAPPPRIDVRVSDVGAVLNALRTSDSTPAFAAFAFTAADRIPGPENATNLQFSLENGRIGFDWVLLAPRNIEDQERFKALAAKLGHSVDSLAANGVSYLRVEDGDLAGLCVIIMREMYGLSDATRVELIVEGLTWPQ